MTFEESEIRKCAASFQYFCENYVSIVNNSKGGAVKFKLYKYQLRVVADIEKYRFNIVKKFRQAGLTTLASIYGLWKCMFDLDQRVLLISKTDREAVAVGMSISDVIRALPDWLKPQMRSDAKHEKYFEATNSIMWFYTPEASRSKSASFLIVDEAAFIKKMDEHYKGLYPTIAATKGKIFVISTVNGNGNWYAETYKLSLEGKNHYHPIDLHYLEHPDYCKPEFEKETKSNLTQKAWNQEFLCQFGSSGDTYIGSTTLAEIEKGCSQPRRKLFSEWDTTLVSDDANPDYEKGAFWEWLPPRASCQYIVSVDASFGLGEESDYSTAQVIDLTNFEQVAEFKSNIINTLEFSKVISQIGAIYNEALIVVEHCGPGIPVLQHLEKMNYPNIYYSQRGKSNSPGIVVDKNNRELIMDNFKTCLTNKLVKINSFRLYSELNTFVINRMTRKPQASKGYHDDLIMAFAIAIYASEIASQSTTMIPNNKEVIGKDLMTEAINIESLQKIRDDLEMNVGEDDDFQWADEIDGTNMLGEVALFDPRFQRKNDSLLRNFGM